MLLWQPGLGQATVTCCGSCVTGRPPIPTRRLCLVLTLLALSYPIWAASSCPKASKPQQSCFRSRRVARAGHSVPTCRLGAAYWAYLNKTSCHILPMLGRLWFLASTRPCQSLSVVAVQALGTTFTQQYFRRPSTLVRLAACARALSAAQSCSTTRMASNGASLGIQDGPEKRHKVTVIGSGNWYATPPASHSP